jgi:hypothetical protein
MRKSTLYFTFIACLIGLSGCSTSPEPLPIAPQTMAGEFLEMSSEILSAGGLAVVGVAESRSLDIALNRAKVNGRLGLAALLEAEMDALRNHFIEETGLDPSDPLLASFADAANVITIDHIQGLVAEELKYETAENDAVTAYALMKLSPLVIVDQLTDEKELSERFLNSQTYEALTRKIKTYEAASTE